MSKRKLTKRQRLCIQKNQQALIVGASEQAAVDRLRGDELRLGQLGQEQPGLVIAHYGAQVEVESLNTIAGTVITRRCHFRSNLGSLVAGDRVIWQDGEPSGLVVAIIPRKTELCRPDPYGDLKTIAANVDCLLVVIAPYPEPHSQLIDRYIVAAEAAAIQPVLVLNKCDLLTVSNGPQLRALLAMYQAIGYLTLETSATLENGLMPLIQVLARRTSVFVGQSGVGKSSLVNALVPTANTPVGAMSTGVQKGTHTTTTAQFFHLSSNGSVIDSPGIRKFGLWHMDEKTILHGFVELRPFIGHCRFADCQHLQEPGCQIHQAFKDQHICAARMQSFEHLRSSIRGGGTSKMER
jgi:ribosome biogenesis GTPase / thiamine phosphate phosphatase